MWHYRFPTTIVWHYIVENEGLELPKSYVDDVEEEMKEQYHKAINVIVDEVNSKINAWNREYSDLYPNNLTFKKGSQEWYHYGEFLLEKCNWIVAKYNMKRADNAYERNFHIFVFLKDGYPLYGICCNFLPDRWLHMEIDVEAAQKQIDEMKKENENGN